LLVLFVVALGLSVLLKTFFVQAFYVPSGSMENTLEIGDRILVNKVSGWASTPQRGEVVVFSDPGGWLGPEETKQPGAVGSFLELFGLYPTTGHLVKRVIGIGGDEVKCCDAQGRILVNGTPLSEQGYLKPGTAPSTVKFDIKVPQGFIWVMGDNRGDSADSRAHLGDPGGGFVPDSDVTGPVFAIIWPWDRLQLLHRPSTFDGIPAGSP
jgi:signal peptidase I